MVHGCSNHLCLAMVESRKKPCSRCCDGFIFTPFITVKGRRIYHPTGVFKFPCPNCCSQQDRVFRQTPNPMKAGLGKTISYNWWSFIFLGCKYNAKWVNIILQSEFRVYNSVFNGRYLRQENGFTRKSAILLLQYQEIYIKIN